MKRITIGILLLLFLAGQGAQAIPVRFPNLAGVAGDTLTVPLYVDEDLSGSNIMSWQFNITYSSASVKLLGVSIAGTISSEFNEPGVKNNGDYFSVTSAGSKALTGKGVLLNVRLVLISSGTYLQFRNGAAENYFNEGTPALTFTYGYISISPKPVISVSPSTAVLNVGDTQQFSAWGGTAPYGWTVSDNTIASITADGKLTVLKSGIVKVKAADAKGYWGESGNVDCRSFYAAIRDTSFFQDNFIEIPVLFTNLDASAVYAGKFVFSFYEGVLSFDSLITNNSLMGATSHFEYMKQSGKAIVTFAGQQAASGSGILFKLRFKIADVPNGGAWISFDEATINEAQVPKTRNGYFSIKPFPTLYISSATPGELFTGTTRQFNVSGGTGPYTWDVENTSLATITATGNLTAIAGGTTQIRVRDVYGARASQAITIYDTWVNVRDTAAVVNNYVLVLPVDVGNLKPGKGIFALSGKAVSNFGKIDSIRVLNSGTITASWQLANKTMKNQANFALSGTEPLTANGKLVFFKFYFSPTLQVNEGFWVDCSELLFNEGSPNVKVKSGYVSIKSIQTALDDQHVSPISVYPVPVKDELVIKLTPEFSTAQLSVLDVAGKILLTTSLKNLAESQYKLSVRDLDDGLYVLKLQTPQRQMRLKFVKK